LKENYLKSKLEQLDRQNSTRLGEYYTRARGGLSDKEQTRLDGILEILLGVTADDEILLAAIILPLYRTGVINADSIKDKSSQKVLNLVLGTHQFGIVHEISADAKSNQIRHKEALRKMLLSMSRDIRVVFVKLAEQLYVIRNLSNIPESQRDKIALDTKNIFAPLANRLGIWAIKWELEDLSFRQLNPHEYQELATKLAEKREEREEYIGKINSILESRLNLMGIKCKISGRSKHIYSIWRKMRFKNKEFSELFDLRALRVLTDTKADCYQILGVVHDLWTPVPKEFDDYISNPKPNNYQSLHTAVRALDNKVIEVQIRTFAMHKFAESGVAAHWRYKEKTKYDPDFESKVKWLRQLIDWKQDVDEQDIDNFTDKLAEDHVYVFTPAGEVLELPAGSTPLDFAYMIHTELGHRTRGAKVNSKIVPLNYKLKTAERVEILTTKEGKPARDWLVSSADFLCTASARSKVKSWFRKKDYDDNVNSGRAILLKEAKKLQVNPDISELVARFYCHSEKDMLAKIGFGDISLDKLAAAFQIDSKKEQQKVVKPETVSSGTSGLVIDGVGKLLTTIAACCQPLPGDSIVGFITKGRGVSIHRADCPNALNLGQVESERMLMVSWVQENLDFYQVNVLVEAYDRPDLLKDITVLFANDKIKIISLDSQIGSEENINKIKLGLQIQNLPQLSRILHKLEQFKNVISANRV